MARSIINKENKKVYMSLREAAEDYGMLPGSFWSSYQKGNFPELEDYKPKAEKMVFGRQPEGRVVAMYGKTKNIYPFSSVSALNDITSTLQHMPSETKQYLYLKSLIK